MTDREVRTTRKPGVYRAGPIMGLWITINATGARSWVFRYVPPDADIRREGATAGRRKPRVMGLGGFPGVSLAMAVKRAEDARRQLAEGLDPLDVRQQAAAAARAAKAQRVTLGVVIEEYLRTRVEADGYFRSTAHQQNWRSTLETYVRPILGPRPIGSIDTNAILEVLHQPTSRKDGQVGTFWSLKPHTASRVRARLEAILDWAAFHDLRPGQFNPARWTGHLQTALVAPTKLHPVRHFAALPYTDMPVFMAALRAMTGTRARMLEYAILAASRANEVRCATWEELDWDRRVWTIPAERMKTGREHTVPITGRMQDLLDSLTPLPDNPYIFTGESDFGRQPMYAMRKVIRDLDYCVTQHGFRSTFRDWAAETGADWAVAEYALAHHVGNATARAYQRSDLLAERRTLMEDWSIYCYSQSN